MIEVDALCKRYPHGVAVEELSFQVPSGQLLALVGESGSGKTTTLKMLNRLLAPSSGVVRIGGRDVQDVLPHELRRQIGYAFQKVGLFPHLTVVPLIITGVRTAAVWTVGAATLATPVGADSLGNFIFSGLQTRNVAAVLVGCCAAAALALLLDGLGKLLLSGIRRRRRARIALALSALGALYVVAAAARPFTTPDTLTVGAKTFTEQYILAELLAERVRTVAHRPARVLASLGSNVAFDALSNGDIDTYVEYTGTLWTAVMKRGEVPADRAEMLTEIRGYLAQRGVMLVAELGFDNSYALALQRARAERGNLRSIGDLARVSAELNMGADYEFFARPEWASLQSVYGLDFRERRSMDPALMYQALQTGAVDVISAYSTDGRIAADDLLVLEDEQHAIPPYDAVVLAGRALRERHPEALAALAELAHSIDSEQMRQGNAAVDLQRRSVADVAHELARRGARSQR